MTRWCRVPGPSLMPILEDTMVLNTELEPMKRMLTCPSGQGERGHFSVLVIVKLCNDLIQNKKHCFLNGCKGLSRILLTEVDFYRRNPDFLCHVYTYL